MSTDYWPEAQDSTAPIKRRMMPVQEPGKRINPEIKAQLVDFAAQRIQAVWDDVGATDAQSLAENVVAAQEWLWLSFHFPVALADHDRRIKAEALTSTFIDVVFDGPPSHESGRFVEVEDPNGTSINAGEWIDRGNGYWALRILTQSEKGESDE